MPTRTWQYTLNPGPRTYMSPWQQPSIKAELLEHIEDTGGRRDWITDDAILTGRAPMSAFDDLDRIHTLDLDLDRDANTYRPSMSSPYGWDTALEGGMMGGTGTHVHIEVSDFDGRHLLVVTITRPDRPPSTEALAHLSADQELAARTSLTLEELRNLVAHPHVLPPAPVQERRHAGHPRVACYVAVVTRNGSQVGYGPFHTRAEAEQAATADPQVSGALVQDGATFGVIPVRPTFSFGLGIGHHRRR